MIEISSNIFFDPTKPWYEQSEECSAFGESIIQDARQNGNFDPDTIIDSFDSGVGSIVHRPRFLAVTRTTDTGTFRMTAQYNWLHNPEDLNWEHTKRAFGGQAAATIINVSQIGGVI